MSFTGKGGAAFSQNRDDWETPKELFKTINNVFHFTHEYVLKADEIVFIKGRLHFTLHGEKQGSAPFPSMLVRFGGSLPKIALK